MNKKMKFPQTYFFKQRWDSAMKNNLHGNGSFCFQNLQIDFLSISFLCQDQKGTILTLIFCFFPEFAKTEKGYSMAGRLQHILSEALRYSIAKTQKDPSLLPRLMRFMSFDLEHYRRADMQESAMIYSKFGAIMNVCLPLTYDIYCQAD